jgi:hypothetical protein
LLALHRGIDALDRIADGDELVLRFLPLTVVDQLLHLLKLRGRQRYLVGAGGFLLTEDRRAHSVERVARACAVHGRAESADAQHRRGHGSDDREGPTGAAVLGQPAVKRLDGVTRRDGSGDGGVPNVVAPPGEQEGEFGFRMIGWVGGLFGRERFEEPVGPVDLVERRVSTVGRPPTEIRHLHASFRSVHP